MKKDYSLKEVNDLFTFIHGNYFNSSAFMDKTRSLDPEWQKRNQERLEMLIEKEEKET